MKSFADLKRYLQPGIKVKMIYNSCSDRLTGKTREVFKVQSNGVYFKDPDDLQSRPSWLEFPPASLIEVSETGFKIFISGLRDLTPEEQAIKAGYEKTRDKKQEEIDLLSDGSRSYYQKIRYYKEHNAEYLIGNTKQKGMMFNYKTGKVKDDKVKGELSLQYLFLA